MERIGIYGGSFNPPHIGHIQAAKQAVEVLNLSKLLVMPAGVAPHKEMPDNSPSAQQRLDMLRLTLAGPSRRQKTSKTWVSASSSSIRTEAGSPLPFRGTLWISFPVKTR